MANCLIAYPNRADEFTLAGGSWVGNLTLANLQNRFLGVVARSTNDALASTQFNGELNITRPVKLFALVNHNFSVSALYRLRVYSDPARTQLLYDTTWLPVWESLSLAELEWEDDNFWTGAPEGEDISGYTWTLPIILPTQHQVAGFLLEIDDTGNPDGYVQIGRLFLGAGFQPVKNMSYGHRIGYETDTAVQTAWSGAEHFDEKPLYRVQRLSLDNMDTDEGLASAFDLVRKVGVSKEVFYLHNPDDTIHKIRRSFLGRLRTLSPLESPYYNTTRMEFEIKEIV